MSATRIRGADDGFEHLKIQVVERIATLTLNRPEKLNAFAGTMRQELAEAIDLVDQNELVRVIVITGAGRAFCAGADVGYMVELSAKNDADGLAALVEAGRTVVTAIRNSKKPVIGSINGVAAGGGANLALACDVRIASDRASLMQSFNRIGLHPDWGATYFLPRLVGPAKALELMWSAEQIGAEEAFRLGLFNKVVPHDQLASATYEFASMLASKPALPLALTKKAVYESLDRSLGEMLDFELDAQIRCFRTDDAREGLNAFVEKRTAMFGQAEMQEHRP